MDLPSVFDWFAQDSIRAAEQTDRQAPSGGGYERSEPGTVPGLYDSTCPGHFGVSSHFIDEDEPSDIKTGLIGFPILARLSDIGPILPCGAQCFV